MSKQAPMINPESIKKILDINDNFILDAHGMAGELTFTYFPYKESDCSHEVLSFRDQINETILESGAKLIPYDQSLVKIPLLKVLRRFFKIIFNNLAYVVFSIIGKNNNLYFIHFGAITNLFKRTRIKKGVTIIALTENLTSNLPIDYTSSFTKNSVITILDYPKNFDDKALFQSHFDTAMNMFAYHMTHIAILVNKDSFIVYNFNASHPVYSRTKNFKQNILKTLIPKISAPIKPPTINEFIVEPETFDLNDSKTEILVKDLINGSKKFLSTGLYPPGKKVEDLPFRSGFYKWIGKIHLDHRSGMSYGFLARQINSKVEDIIEYDNYSTSLTETEINNGFFVRNDKLYIVINLLSNKYVMHVPDVWVITQRSGSNKTNIDPVKDLLILGLVDGKLHIKTPIGNKLSKDYKPSFDTRVIVAHAVGNAITAAISKKLGKNKVFVENFEKNGAAIAHWHGYIRKDLVPKGWVVHGEDNLHVACSTPQSAYYALFGKLNSVRESIVSSSEFVGDIHIEPHHGTNIVFTSVEDLAEYLINTPNVSELGNRYLVEA